MERIYGPTVASQVCGQKSVSGEIAYTLDEEPSEEVRNVALRDAPTDTLSWASTEVRNPYAIDRPPEFDKTMSCFKEGVDRCLKHENCKLASMPFSYEKLRSLGIVTTPPPSKAAPSLGARQTGRSRDAVRLVPHAPAPTYRPKQPAFRYASMDRTAANKLPVIIAPKPHESLTASLIAESVDSTMNDRTIKFPEEDKEYQLHEFTRIRPQGQVLIGEKLLVPERRWAGKHMCSMQKECYGCDGDLLVRVLYPPTQKKTASGTVGIDSWVAGDIYCDSCAACMTLEGKYASDDLRYYMCVLWDTDLRSNAPRRAEEFKPPQQPLDRINYRFRELREKNPGWAEEYDQWNSEPEDQHGKDLARLMHDAYRAHVTDPDMYFGDPKNKENGRTQ